MVGLLFATIVQDSRLSVQDTSAWKAYAAVLAEAKSVELRWTVLGNGKVEDKFALLVRDKEDVSLERADYSLTVWDGKKGIHVFHKLRTYQFISQKQGLEWADYFEVPGVFQGKGNRTWRGIRETYLVDRGRSYEVVSAIASGLDVSSHCSFFFDAKSKLMAKIECDVRGMIEGGDRRMEYRIEKFDLNPRIADSAFNLSPPEGYKEWKPGH